MAAPANVNIKNLQGKWIMNKTLSDSPDPVLALQGVNWLTRKAIGLTTVTQHLRQLSADGEAASTEIVVEQFGTAGVQGTTERRTMDWRDRRHEDWLFGTLVGRARYSTLEALVREAQAKGGEEMEDANYLVDAWSQETEQGEMVESFADNEAAKWTAWQVWGFADINGERRLTRRFVIRKKDKNKVVRVRLTYDWAGEL
ncbi:hypothetical protein ACEQ8H_000812 [Pleosporales sp. CAS-2024a]